MTAISANSRRLIPEVRAYLEQVVRSGGPKVLRGGVRCGRRILGRRRGLTWRVRKGTEEMRDNLFDLEEGRRLRDQKLDQVVEIAGEDWKIPAMVLGLRCLPGSYPTKAPSI